MYLISLGLLEVISKHEYEYFTLRVQNDCSTPKAFRSPHPGTALSLRTEMSISKMVKLQPLRRGTEKRY